MANTEVPTPHEEVAPSDLSGLSEDEIRTQSPGSLEAYEEAVRQLVRSNNIEGYLPENVDYRNHPIYQLTLTYLRCAGQEISSAILREVRKRVEEEELAIIARDQALDELYEATVADHVAQDELNKAISKRNDTYSARQKATEVCEQLGVDPKLIRNTERAASFKLAQELSPEQQTLLDELVQTQQNLLAAESTGQ